MDRREFVRYLAAVGASISASPQAFEALTRYYEANTPVAAEGLVALDEILISGMATSSRPCLIEFADPPLKYGVNLFGGIFRWVAAPDAKIVRPRHLLTWRLTPRPEDYEFTGQVSYVDQNAVRHYVPIGAGSLDEV